MKAMKSIVVAVIFIAVACLVMNIVEAASGSSRYELTYLPSLNAKPTFKQYTGFVQIPSEKQADKRLFYWFVTSKRNPLNDPVVLWLTGGPGRSMNFHHDIQ